MIINHNIAALNTHRQLSANTAATNKNIEKLSSGLRINRAGDDAAGLAISEKMRGQIRGLDQASRNAQDGISLIQTAEGALNETHSILQRMREISNQSANGTNTDTDRGALQDEMNQLTSEINRIGNTTEFNTQKLLNGGITSSDSSKITQATSASRALGAVTTAATIGAGTTLKVDNQTFDLSGTALLGGAGNATADIATLGNITSGGTKLSDLVDITSNAGKLTFTAKSQGSNSAITFGGAADAALGSIAADIGTFKGTATTVERAGVEATAATSVADVSFAAGDSLSITIGNGSAVTVNLNTGTSAKSYATSTGIDQNAKDAANAEVIKDLNAALQQAGLDGQVSASISDTGKVQFISESGKDITVANGSGTPVTALGGGLATIGNVQQVVGPGAQGSGFSTKFQIGANTGQSMSLTINDVRSAALGITGNAGQAGFTKTNSVTNGTNDVKSEAALNISTREDASKAIAVLDKATSSVSSERAKLGAVQNRLEHTINNLGTASENLTAAESRIRDVDMAKEMMEQTKNNILAQAAQAMLAQANQQPQGVLQLLR